MHHLANLNLIEAHAMHAEKIFKEHQEMEKDPQDKRIAHGYVDHVPRCSQGGCGCGGGGHGGGRGGCPHATLMSVSTVARRKATEQGTVPKKTGQTDSKL